MRWKTLFSRSATLAIATLSWGLSSAAGLGPIARMPSRIAPDLPMLSVQLGADAVRSVASPNDILLPPITPSEEYSRALTSPAQSITGIGRSPGVFGIDAVRDLNEATLSVAFRVFSPGAKHLRTGLLLPAMGSYRVTTYAPGQEHQATLVSRSADNDARQQILWTGMSDGDTQNVVVERSGADGPWSASVISLSHFPDYVNGPQTRVKAMSSVSAQGFGDSASCQIDISCLIDAATPTQQSQILLASRAVAIMITTDTLGNTYTCTGTLLNSANYPAPLLITANHCVDNAASLLTLWFYSRTTCGSGAPSAYTQVTGGGTVLYKSAALDAALVLLNQIPPAPVSYSGWDQTLIAEVTSILAIHHPRGDVKKASFGQVIGINQTPASISGVTYAAGTFYLVNWQYGIVEPGSSGSGLFTFGDFDQYFYLRGTLTGGRDACNAPGSLNYYSELHNVYPYISNALSVKASFNLNQHGLTGSWYEAATGGQGVEVEVFANPSAGTGSTFVSWFTYDTVAGGAERQRWYTAQGPVVTGQPNAALTIYRNTGGNFNAPPVTTAQGVGTATLSFDTCSSGQLAYAFTDGTGRAGTIPLTRLTQNVTCSTTSSYPTNADFALSGNWFGGAATSGQGFTVEVNPISGAFFAAWYTYMPNGTAAGAAGQRWYTAQASFTPGLRSMPVTIYETTGGVFDAPTPPGQKTVPVGTGTMAFQSCSAATFRYNFTGGSSSGLSGTINLGRVGPLPPGCTT